MSKVFGSIWSELAQVPMSPEALGQGLRGGLSGDLSWNPYSQGNSVWDTAAGGTKLSEDPNNRQIGRQIGTMIAGAFTGGALSGAAGAGTGEVVDAGVGASTGGAVVDSSGTNLFADQISASAGGTGTSGATTSGIQQLGQVTVTGQALPPDTPTSTGPFAGATAAQILQSNSGGDDPGLSMDTGPAGGGIGNAPSYGGPGTEGAGAAGEGAPSFYDQMLERLKSFAGGKGNLRGGLNIASGLTQLSRGRSLSRSSDPFAKYRAGYGAQLAALEANPSSMTNLPGYQAGLQAIQRAGAAQGYTGSGNMAVSLAKYGGDFYNQQVNRLAGLAGAGAPVGQGAMEGNAMEGAGIGAISQGLMGLFGNG